MPPTSDHLPNFPFQAVNYCNWLEGYDEWAIPEDPGYDFRCMMEKSMASNWYIMIGIPMPRGQLGNMFLLPSNNAS
jgi:hypothetical protein